MAHAGQIIHNPQTGETITFLKTSADSDGKLLQLECRVAPGRGLKIPPHMHPLQEMRLEMKAGQMKFEMRGQKRVLKPGDRVTVPPTVYYNWRQLGNEELDFVAEYEPAEHWEDIFESTFELARAAAAGRRQIQPLALAVIAAHYPNHMRVQGLPAPVQVAFISALAFMGRLLGYKPIFHYEGD